MQCDEGLRHVGDGAVRHNRAEVINRRTARSVDGAATERVSAGRDCSVMGTDAEQQNGTETDKDIETAGLKLQHPTLNNDFV